jgi:hypothetical protein
MVEFEADVYVGGIYDPFGMLDPPDQLPNTLTGTYRYEVPGNDLEPDDLESGWYLFDQQPNGIRVNFGRYEFVTGTNETFPLNVWILNKPDDTFMDSFSLYGANVQTNDVEVSPEDCGIDVQFADGTGYAIPYEEGDRLPDYAPNSDDWGYVRRIMIMCHGIPYEKWFDISARITSATLVTETPMEALQIAVEELEEDGYITEDQRAGLYEKLLKADVKFNSDFGSETKNDAACNQMEAFLRQFEALAKFIDDSDYLYIIGLLEDVMKGEGCWE